MAAEGVVAVVVATGAITGVAGAETGLASVAAIGVASGVTVVATD